jgi:hypothetical protein
VRHLLPLVLVLGALPARAGDGFEALRHRAERVESLQGFLSRFVGECKDPYEKRACEKNVQAARRSFEGKVLVARVADGAELVRAESQGEHFRIFLTPFIDGGGYALTHGAPVGQDSAGRPRIGFVVLRGELPPGVGDMEWRSAFRTGSVEMEVVFRPEGTWKMKRKDSAGWYEGVKARFLGVRLLDPRTGSEIASRVL